MRPDMRHRPYSWRPRAGRSPIRTSFRLPRKIEGARNAGSATDPRTPTPRDIEACRNPNNPPSPFRASAGMPQVRHVTGVPRAMFEVCSAKPPVDLPFRPPSSSARAPIHRYGPRRSRLTFDRLPATPSMGPGDVRLARRDSAAWTAGRVVASHLQRPLAGHRSPPRVCRRLIRRPSMNEAG